MAASRDYKSCNIAPAEALPEQGRACHALASTRDAMACPSAYDKAWVVRVPAIDGSTIELEWVLQNQLEDGSWGLQSHFLASDRLLNTLSCVLALTEWKTGHMQVKRGIEFIEKKQSGLTQLSFARERPVEYYFTVAVGMFETEFSACRMAFTKIASLITVLETFLTLTEPWDFSLVDCLPDYLKICFKKWYKTANELAKEAQKEQGRDLLGLFRTVWEDSIGAFLQEAELTADEYAEKARGELASSIEYYMKDNPGSSEEAALDHIYGIIHICLKELNWEFLKPDHNVPLCVMKLLFNSGRIAIFIYKNGDASAFLVTK
eukprot:Gb_10196 [translate_table: standard]